MGPMLRCREVFGCLLVLSSAQHDADDDDADGDDKDDDDENKGDNRH